MVPITCPRPLRNMMMAYAHASGRNPCIPRAATGVRQNKIPHTRMCPIRNSRNAIVGTGNEPQRSRRMVTVGLYTARKPVVASSKICSAKAAQSANHALPKPDAESAGGACLNGAPIATNTRASASKKQLESIVRRISKGRTWDLASDFTHQRQKVFFRVAEERHPQIMCRHSRD